MELAELAFEIDEGFSGKVHRATPEALAGIERGLKDAHGKALCNERASQGDVRQISSCMKVVYAEQALHNLDGISDDFR